MRKAATATAAAAAAAAEGGGGERVICVPFAVVRVAEAAPRCFGCSLLEAAKGNSRCSALCRCRRSHAPKNQARVFLATAIHRLERSKTNV